MEQLTTLAEIKAAIATGRTIIIFSKENCPNCTITKANIEKIQQEATDVVFYEVKAIQEDNEINRSFLPRKNFMFPVIHSFANGEHVRGTTGLRSVEQLRESFVPVNVMKTMFYDITAKHRHIEDTLRKDIDGNVSVNIINEPPVPLADPSEDMQCDSCQ
jgi:glutaredoxin